MTAATPLLAMTGIGKRFPGVVALRGVDLEVRRGEVQAVVGENGAGKSTLMNIIAGVFPPDAGRIDLGGEADLRLANEAEAQARGVATVYQERSLFAPLSVAENIFAGRQPVGRLGAIDRRALRERSAALLASVGLAVDPDATLGDLSTAQQQLVEVAKALSLDARLFLFDEPTAALTGAEAASLFAVISRLKARGAGIVYISHRLEEVLAMADRVTVLKDGAGQGTFAAGDLRPRDLVALMVGRDLEARPVEAPILGEVLLEVEGLSDGPGPAVGPRLAEVRFAARAGEVVALAGLVGAGRTELALAIFGMRPGIAGTIRVGGRVIGPKSPAEAIAAGIGYLPEDRKDDGLFLDMGVADNVAAAADDRFGSWAYRESRRDEAAVGLCRSLRVACRGPREPVGQLSGGNQQKVVLARWLLAGPRVLIVDEPTRGVDVGAKAEIHGLLREQARRGAAVIVISSDLPEVLAVADRILVMREGRLVGELDAATATEAAILERATLGTGQGGSPA